MKESMNLVRAIFIFSSFLIFSSVNAASLTNGNFVQISTSPALELACGVLKSGKVQCLGAVSELQAVPSNLENVKEISIGDSHVCALLQNGKVSCWAVKGDYENSSKLIKDTSAISDAVKITSGSGFSCIIDKAKKVKCWGNLNGDKIPPVPANVLDDNIQIVANGDFACVLKVTGSVICWGVKFPEAYFKVKETLPLQDIMQITLSAQNLCALNKNGQVYCWLDGNKLPAKVFDNVVEIAMGTNPLTGVEGRSDGTICALLKDGRTACFFVDSGREVKIPLSYLNNSKQVSVGNDLICQLSQDGLVTCWGKYGKIYLDTQSFSEQTVLIGKNEVNHRCALRKNGTVFCWGNNEFNQASPPADLRDVKELSLGIYHSCALTLKGQVRCWGSNDEGQLTQPEGLKDTVHITAFSKSTCAFNKKAELTCWGDENNQDRFHKSRIMMVQGFLTKLGTATSLKCNGQFTVTASFFGPNNYSVNYQCTNKGKEKNITLQYRVGHEYPFDLYWDEALDIGLTPAKAQSMFKTFDNSDICRPSYLGKWDVECYLGSEYVGGYIWLFHSGDVYRVTFP